MVWVDRARGQVLTRSAAPSAAARVLKEPAATAVSTMSPGAAFISEEYWAARGKGAFRDGVRDYYVHVYATSRRFEPALVLSK